MICTECGAMMRESCEVIVEQIRGVEVAVDGIEHFVCDKCGNIAVNAKDANELGRRQAEAVARATGLLLPSQIRDIRESLGLTQSEFGDLIGVTFATVSRWETGAMLPSKSADTLMRVLAEFSEVVAFLQKH